MVILYGILALLILFAAIVLLRAAKFKPDGILPEASEKPDLNFEKAVSHFSELIRFKTVSSYDWDEVDEGEFEALRTRLKTLYPRVHTHCTREEVGKTGLLFRWPGKQSGAPTVLMSHYDVVPAVESLWTHPVFEGAVEDGFIWGRGTLDTKGTLCGILEAVEYWIEKGFVPAQDVYLSFSGDEEVSGPSAPAIVRHLKERGIHPALVLDEGGAVVDGVFPGVTFPTAMVGIGEKGYMDVRFEVTGKGGHASAPPPHSLLGDVARAITKIETHPFKAHLTPPAKEMLETLGRYSSFGMRVVLANLWCFEPLIKVLFTKQGGEMNAMIRSTVAVTRAEGSKAYNVLPPKAYVGLNLRLLVTEDKDSALEHLTRTINDPRFEAHIVDYRSASPYASTASDGFAAVKRAIEKTWSSTIVSPYLMLAGSDSRHFSDICDHVLKFSAMHLSKEELGLIHGNDERIAVEGFEDMISFYVHLIEML